MKFTKVTYELTKCLGWCGNRFLSPDKCGVRYCKVCAARKEQVERRSAKTRSLGDGLKLSQ